MNRNEIKKRNETKKVGKMRRKAKKDKQVSLNFCVLLLVFFMFFILSCKKGGGSGGNIGGGGGGGGGNTVDDKDKCSARIDFFPQEVSGEAPLAVTFSANFSGSAEGITAVWIDFGSDSFVEIEEYKDPPTVTFSYVSEYSSVGSFSDTFIFWWKEGEENCSRSFTVNVRTTFLCPTPSVEVRAQTISGNQFTVWVRPTNLPLKDVSFFAGYDIPRMVSCYEDGLFVQSCRFTVSFPSFGDWSLCWYAESFCGKRSDMVCTPVLVSYPFSHVMSYGVGAPSGASLSENFISVQTPPYISIVDRSGKLINRLKTQTGNPIFSASDENGVWVFEIGDKFVLSFIRYTGESRAVIQNLFGVSGFEIYRRGAGKRYAFFVRSFTEGDGDILVFDVSNYEASSPICKKVIPSGAVGVKVFKDNIFVRYTDALHIYRVTFAGDICQINDNAQVISFDFPAQFVDIEAGVDKAMIVWATFAEPMKGKFKAMLYSFNDGSFQALQPQSATAGDSQVWFLKVSPYNISHVAVSFFSGGEYRVKLFDFASMSSIGGVEGFSIKARPTSIVFSDSLTLFVFDEAGNISILSFSKFEKLVRKFSGVSHPNAKHSASINCDTSEMSEFLPDGSALVKLDISPVFSQELTLPEPITFIDKSAVFVSPPYGVFIGDDGKAFLSDLTFSFSITFESDEEIFSFSSGMTHFILGGSKATYFARKGFSKFILLEKAPLKSSFFVSPYFFLFSGSSLSVYAESENVLTKLLSFPIDCFHVAVSDDGGKIYCVRSFGVIEYLFDGNMITKRRERAFSLPIGNVKAVDFERDHIFFVSDLAISMFFGIIDTRELKVVLLSPLDDEEIAYGILAKGYCVPNVVFFSIYGNLSGAVSKGYLVAIP